LRLGFIGTGTITRAIVAGLCRSADRSLQIFLSPRNAEVAAYLARQFSCVRVGVSNQEVVDCADTLVLAVRPQDAFSALSSLRFNSSQRVVSLIASLSYETLLPLIAPAKALTLAAPLPTVEYGRGPTAIFPPSAEVEALFSAISVPVQVEQQTQFQALFACTAEMASYFKLLRTCAAFLEQRGLAQRDAERYVAALFDALGHTAMESVARSLQDLVADHMTKGGLNEQVYAELCQDGVFASHTKSLTNILARIEAAGIAGRETMQSNRSSEER
jgi:pyrroline-5-carboxylate reductase